MKKEFTTWDVFVIGLNMFVLGMLLFRTTTGSSDGVGTSRYVSELVVVLIKISTWFMVIWMIAIVGMSIHTYMKNRKSGLSVWLSVKRYTWAYLLLEIPLVFAYQLAINGRM